MFYSNTSRENSATERVPLSNGARKLYVDVTARIRDDGRVVPLAVHWHDGRTFQIERVVGGPFSNGFPDRDDLVKCYVVDVGGRTTHVYLERVRTKTEESLRWFVLALPERSRSVFGTGRAQAAF